jgi:predicted O-linked N-acetylglucosamine transferase (SPINDLY family)
MSTELAIQRALEDARQGRLPQALAAVRSLAQRKPKDMNVAQVLGLLLAQSGEYEQARHHLSRAVAAEPRAPGYRNNLANVLLQMGRDREAAEQLAKAIELDPTYARGYLGLASARLRLRDARAAIDVAERGLRLQPSWPELTMTLMTALEESGRIDDAIARGRAALAAHPRHAGLWSQVLMLTNYTSLDADEIASLHRAFGSAMGPAPATPAFDRSPDRRLRVGFLSSDFRTHSVAYFARPLLAASEPRDGDAGYDAIAFSLLSTPDDPMTKALRAQVTEWHDVGLADDATLDRMIRDARIDVLVELGGHFGGNRLAVVARRPAPLVVTAIGYPNTTGLDAVDLRLVDSRTDPPGSETHATERLLRLDPCFLCYTPPLDAPEPTAIAADAPFTFGSFNALAKVGDASCALWAKALAAVPDARLLLKTKALADGAARDALLERLVRAGIAPDRVELAPSTATVAEHLALYGRIHVALDTFPYHGTTTTCEALWMGVPVVTRAGDRHAARVGASLLACARLEELVASDDDAFAASCARLAADRAGLAALRGALRERLRASPLLDAAAYRGRFAHALREAWRARCRDA